MERIFPLQLPVGKITALNLQEILNEEKLLRLHPHWRIDTLNREEQVLRVFLTDYATEQELRLGLRLDLNVRPDILMRITLVDHPIATVDLVADTNGLAARVQAQSLDEDTERKPPALAALHPGISAAVSQKIADCPVSAAGHGPNDFTDESFAAKNLHDDQ
jgi:hypothetical protein